MECSSPTKTSFSTQQTMRCVSSARHSSNRRHSNSSNSSSTNSVLLLHLLSITPITNRIKIDQ